MSSKRRADKYLTDQNWNEEEEKEEAGKFEPASRDVLKQRVFKKAKRRINQLEENTSAFKGFSGLTAPKSSSNGFQGFKMNPTSNFSSPSKQVPAVEDPKVEPHLITEKTLAKEPVSATTISEQTPLVKQAPQEEKDGDKASTTSKISVFDRHIIALNKSVSKWIAEHVEKDPLCDLTPIFTDYQQHYSNIEDKYASSSYEETVTAELLDEDEDEPTPTFSELPKSTTFLPAQAVRAKTPPKNPLGIIPTSSTASSSPFMGFGKSQEKPSTSTFTGFQFGSKMVTSSQPASVQRDTQTAAAEDDEYVPPKPESSIVEEKDAFYTKRCKLFYMKDGSYADKGVGHLHLKDVSGKTQLIIRADTTLGNVLLNIVLNSAMPVAKQGKNNVVVSCVPNPPIDEKDCDKVVPMLIRVKTSDEADELVDILSKKKQESD